MSSEMNRFVQFKSESGERSSLAGENELIVRPAGESDLDELAGIAAEWEGENVEDWLPIMQQAFEESRRSDRSLLLVATFSGLALGYGRATFFSPPGNSPSNAAPEGWYLTGVVVRPGYRRRGVGAELTRERLARIAPLSTKAYYFANARNAVTIELHRRFGFQEMTRDFWFPRVRFTDGTGILFCSDLSGGLPLFECPERGEVDG